ncbi:ABC transporter substrate-binding protein [Brachybacterium conglomeratum]|uniref:ABC transporter substrate-binding protein n=1 Tax=Brachybacterium conglomeratum TaxID=47846 RepID=UPI003DA0B33F
MTRNDARTPGHSARPPLARRTLLSSGAALALSGSLGGCGFFASGAAETDGDVMFWDMPWSGTEYSQAGRQIAESYTPAQGLLPASYQTIQWNGFLQTFNAAVASDTAPAASSGGGFQVFQFAEDGAIASADSLVAMMQEDGIYEDFLPGLLDGMKTDAGYIAVPWQLDLRPIWYRPSVLEKAGVAPPTTWDEWREVAVALQRIGVRGFAIGAGSGNNVGTHVLISLMINNGGGLFDEDGNPDCLFDRNVEAMEFVHEMVVDGHIDPAALSYTTDNARTQWAEGAYAFGFDSADLANGLGDTADDLEVADLIHGPHGDTGTLQFINNLMMYAGNPSQESTEAFLLHYLREMRIYWDEGLIGALPVLRSIRESEAFGRNRHATRMLDIWQPVAKQYSQRSPTPFAMLSTLDGGVPITRFVQTMLSRDGDPTEALGQLQTALETR